MNDYVQEPGGTTVVSLSMKRRRNMLEGWCMDNHHHPLLTANLAEAALLENCIITVLMLLLPFKSGVSYEGIWLFDISIKIFFQTYRWSGNYQVHFLLGLVKGQDWDNHGSHLTDFNLAFSVFSRRFGQRLHTLVSSWGSINYASHLCIHDYSAYEGPHNGVESTASNQEHLQPPVRAQTGPLVLTRSQS